jgi:glycosyltransferase involved in cell wall biosynthesis
MVAHDGRRGLPDGRNRAMAAPPLTTIVVVSCDYSRFLSDAVASAVEQTAAAQVIIVDDASTDDTPALLPQLEARYPSIVCHVLPSRIGLARLRNYAAELATTEWILYLDADDWLDRSYLARAEAWLRTHPDTDVLTTDMAIVGADGAERTIVSMVPRFWNDLLQRNTIAQTSLIRRVLIGSAGGYDPTLEFEDWDFWIRLLQSGRRIDRLPGTHVFWRDHGLNKSKRCDERAAAAAVRRKHQRLSS